MTPNQITAEQVRETFKRYRLPLPWGAKLDDCKHLCAGWHNQFGACRVLDDNRLRALCRRLVDDGYSYEQCRWAIEAYHDFCTTDRWHVENPDARKTLAAFFRDERFEEWIEKGEQLRLRRSGGRRRAAERRNMNALSEQLNAAWRAKLPAEQQRLVDRAVAELNMQHRPAHLRTITHAAIRAKVRQYLQAELREQQPSAATAVGELV